MSWFISNPVSAAKSDTPQYREVMHEKLCDPDLRWEENDLVDMMFLTVGAGYCTHVVGERSHAAHLRHSQQRLGRQSAVHRNLRDLVQHL